MAPIALYSLYNELTELTEPINNKYDKITLQFLRRKLEGMEITKLEDFIFCRRQKSFVVAICSTAV